MTPLKIFGIVVLIGAVVTGILGDEFARREQWRLTAIKKRGPDEFDVVLDMGDGDKLLQRATIRRDGLQLRPTEGRPGVRLLLEKK